MHELALAQNIIELLEEQAVNHQFSKVKQVWLEIGVMACVEVPALHLAWTSPLVIPLLTMRVSTLLSHRRKVGVCPVINPSPLKHPHSVVHFVIQAKCR